MRVRATVSDTTAALRREGNLMVSSCVKAARPAQPKPGSTCTTPPRLLAMGFVLTYRQNKGPAMLFACQGLLRKMNVLPGNLLRKEFCEQVVVVRLQFFGVRLGVSLGVEVVHIELVDPLEHVFIVLRHQVFVGPVTVRGI